jgi:hypothetical protein
VKSLQGVKRAWRNKAGTLSSHHLRTREQMCDITKWEDFLSDTVNREFQRDVPARNDTAITCFKVILTLC